VGLSPEEVTELFNLPIPTQLNYGTRFVSSSNRNEYQKIFLGSREWPVRNADTLNAICDPTF
jgi:hypothetical protein